MKRKYILYLTILLVVLFRMQILNIFNNFSKLFLKKETNPEIEILQKEVSDLTDEYSKLLDFKNSIVLNESYTSAAEDAAPRIDVIYWCQYRPSWLTTLNFWK